MKKIIYLLLATLMMMCAVECSAQTDIWAWQNGQYTKFEKADSITFVDPTANPTVADSNIIDGHEYVDLGLPSGLKWATYNVGASKPTEYGDYFAWGETTPKEKYIWPNYKWCKGSYDTQTKYCVNSEYGPVDSLTILLAEDDAATANWGAGWRMPTKAEQDELRDGCDWEWTDDFNGSGVAGSIGTSKSNGNTIFLPAAGYRDGWGLDYAGDDGFYLSSSLHELYSHNAYDLRFNGNHVDWNYGYRYDGRSVRAVVK